MSWPKLPAPLRCRRLTVLSSSLCLFIGFLALEPSGFFRGLIRTVLVGQTVPEPRPELRIYDWDTRSSFNPVRLDNVANMTNEELCSFFPTRLLDEIQPVLKIGHGVLEDGLRPQLQSVSDCLTNLLIFSDTDEEFQGHEIIDVISDIPSHLKEESKAFRAYQNGSLADGTATRTAGWTMDKFKFLPAISRAWKMRPERRWYVFYEADTYVVWDNMFRLLQQFDPDVPHYFGSPSPGEQKTWYANGGPGFVLSREAMRKLIRDDWDSETGEYLGTKLTERYWKEVKQNCCGDSSLGWVLWKENVALSGLWPMFNPHPPHGVPFADRYWCQPVLTMHKPRAEDMLGIWRWEWEHRQVHVSGAGSMSLQLVIDTDQPLTTHSQRPLLYRDLAMSYFNLTSNFVLTDWDNAGWDDFNAPTDTHMYSHNPHTSPDACSLACEAHQGCFQWTYHLRKCTFVRSFRLGRQQAPGLSKRPSEAEQWTTWDLEDLRFVSGWAAEKIKMWMDERPCEKVRWVRPSTKRIF